MARILLVYEPTPYRDFSYPARLLQRMGFSVKTAFLIGVGSTAFRTTEIGTIDPESTTARNYLRTFDAIFVIDFNYMTITSSGLSASASWMRWNEDPDPPVCYCGLNLNASISVLNTRLPADFPIIRYDPNNPTTYSLAETETNTAPHARSYGVAGITGGTPCRLLRENQRLYVWSPYTYRDTPPYGVYFLKLNPSAHETLSQQIFTWRGMNMNAGEVLARPDYPESDYSGGRTFNTDTIVAYRYRQHLILPMVGTHSGVLLLGAFSFWGPYALKLLGIPAEQKIPVYHEFDHFLQVQISQIDLDTALSNYLATYEWLDSFCKQRNTHIVAGTYRSLTYNGQSLFFSETERNPTQDSHHLKFNQILSFLRETHRRGTIQICLHDHADTGWGHTNHNTTVYRHQGREYGIPKNVRKKHGQVVHASQISDPNSLPEGSVRIEIGGEAYWDLPVDSSDSTGTTHLTPPYQHNCLHHARITIERGIDYCTNILGFPDAFAGEHRYCNTAKNHAGMIGFWQTLRNYGIRGIRTNLRPEDTGQVMCVPASQVWNGLVFLYHTNLESQQGWHGLYNPAYTTNWVSSNGLNIAGDITTNWAFYREAMAWRAYQRAMSSSIYGFLQTIGTFRAPYRHPVTSISSAYPADPTADFNPALLAHSSIQDANNTVPAFNHILDIMKEMDKVVNVLSDYLYWGTVTDVMNRIREEAGV